MRNQREALDGAIAAEVQRVIDAQQAEASAAASRAASLRASISRNRGILAANNAASVKLAELNATPARCAGSMNPSSPVSSRRRRRKGCRTPNAQIVASASLPLKPSAIRN